MELKGEVVNVSVFNILEIIETTKLKEMAPKVVEYRRILSPGTLSLFRDYGDKEEIAKEEEK